MKDEEMAEEIANKRCHEIMCYGHCSFSSPKHHRCGEWHREYNCALEGLKAGRPQWHDLEKDQTDLPEKMGLGSKEVYVAYENGVTDFACYRFDKKCWERSENEELAENVIAWCEIPTFDKDQ